LIVVHRVQIVLIRPQFVSTLFELLGRCSGSGRFRAMERWRPDFQLFRVLSLRGENQKRSEDKY
jgi:hypothetical protein